MAHGLQRSMDFWCEFDNYFNPSFGHVSNDVKAAYRGIQGFGFILGRWREHRDNHTYPDGFRADMVHKRDPLLFLASKQAELLDRYFAGDPDGERTAFEEFGQGILFDDRRPDGDKIHKMDMEAGPPVGYHRWHAIIRAAVMVGADAERWVQIDRNVGLAWAIQSEVKPANDAPNNPGLPPERLGDLRSIWQAHSFDDLDTAFDSDPYPPGVDARGVLQRARSGYDQLDGL